MYQNQLIFNAIFNKGQLYTGAKPDGDVYQKKAELHIGYIAGEKRQLRAGMTDSVLESDPYYLFNITDQDNIYMESVAILGVAHVSDAEYYAQRYFAETLGACMNVVFVGAYSAQTLKRFLDSELSAITPRIKPEQVQRFIDVVVKQTVDWSDDYLLSHQGNTRLLLSDMVASDDRHELLAPMDIERFAEIIHTERDKEQLDALFTDVVGLQRLARQLTLEMDKKATDKVKLDKITQSEKPFKRNGMTNLALHIAMSDGQTVAVLFYNPDETPSKLQPKDILVSWKWLLNNRDVTPALQPETGKDVNISILASRIMQLVDKNHARFIRNQAKQKAQDERLEALSQIVTQKQEAVADLDKQIADMQARLDRVLAGDKQAEPANKTLLDISTIKPLLIDDERKIKKAIEAYLSQFKDSYIKTVDNKSVVFNSKGRNHLANDVAFDKTLMVGAIEKMIEVLTLGEFIERQELKKVRTNDDYVAFHVYRKWVVVEDKELHLQIKVAELKDGSFEVGNGLIAYSAKNAGLLDGMDTKNTATPPVSLYDSLLINSGDCRICHDDSLFDSLSQDDYVFLEILEVRPIGGGATHDDNQESQYEYQELARNLWIDKESFNQEPTGEEYAIWGVPEKGSFEDLLVTRLNGKLITTQEQAERVAEVMVSIYGAKDVRIQQVGFNASAVKGVKSAFGGGVVAKQDEVPKATQSTQEETITTDENKEPMSHPDYTQEDIEFLNGIIAGVIPALEADMDKVIAIGEKNDSDPLFEQALQIISTAENTATQGV